MFPNMLVDHKQKHQCLCWSRFPPIRWYQEGAATDPKVLQSPVSTYVPITKVEGFTDLGFPPVRPLDPKVTTICMKPEHIVARRHPVLPSPGAQWAARIADKSHQCSFHNSGSTNNTKLAANSTTIGVVPVHQFGEGDHSPNLFTCCLWKGYQNTITQFL